MSVSIRNKGKYEVVHLDIDSFKEKMNGYLALVEVLSKSKSLNFESCIFGLKSIFTLNTEYVQPNYKVIGKNLLTKLDKEITTYKLNESEISDCKKKLSAHSKEVTEKVKAYKEKLESSASIKKIHTKLADTLAVQEVKIKEIIDAVEQTVKDTLLTHKNVRKKDLIENIYNELNSPKNRALLGQDTLGKIKTFLDKM